MLSTHCSSGTRAAQSSPLYSDTSQKKQAIAMPEQLEERVTEYPRLGNSGLKVSKVRRPQDTQRSRECIVTNHGSRTRPAAATRSFSAGEDHASALVPLRKNDPPPGQHADYGENARRPACPTVTSNGQSGSSKRTRRSSISRRPTRCVGETVRPEHSMCSPDSLHFPSSESTPGST